MVKDKESALKTAMSQLDKQFGVGTIMRLGDKPVSKVEVIPTGAINLDAALGIGGIPRGRVTEIYGPEASGKTTLALHIVSEAQKKDGIVAFIDVEHALDPSAGAGKSAAHGVRRRRGGKNHPRRGSVACQRFRHAGADRMHARASL